MSLLPIAPVTGLVHASNISPLGPVLHWAPQFCLFPQPLLVYSLFSYKMTFLQQHSDHVSQNSSLTVPTQCHLAPRLMAFVMGPTPARPPSPQVLQ